MEIHQLRYLDLVVREGTYTRAAERAHVSQSGLSTQVAKLERELGHQLLRRGRHGATLTSQGESIYPAVRRALRAIDEIAVAADDLGTLARGSIGLSVVIGCTMPFVVAGLAEFRRAHPAVSVELREGASDVMIEDLLHERLDLALVGHAQPLPSPLTSHLVAEDRVVAVYPPGSTPPKTTSLARLTAEDIITMPTGTGVREAIDRAPGGVDVNPTYEVHASDMAVELIEAGAGVGILSEGMLRSSSLPTAPLRGIVSRLSLAYRPEISPAAARLRDLFVTHLGR